MRRLLTVICLLLLTINSSACAGDIGVPGTWYLVDTEADKWVFCENGDITVDDEIVGTYTKEDEIINIVYGGEATTAVYDEETDEITGFGYVLVKTQEEAEERGLEEFEAEKILIREELQDSWRAADGQSIKCNANFFTLNDISYNYEVISDEILLLSHDGHDIEAKFNFIDEDTLTIDYGAGEITFSRQDKP